MARKDIIISERIDRNGTKHQEVETGCSRCGGQGQSDKWLLTGKVCFKCGGSGRQREKRKVYTPEHADKLEANRRKREEKKLAEQIAKAPETTNAELTRLGFNQEKIYVVAGNTYEIKDELREKGARFSGMLSVWFFTEDKPEYETYELETKKLYEVNKFGNVSVKGKGEISDYLDKQAGLPDKKISKHYGEIGEKIELELTVEKTFWVDGMYGGIYINKLVDEQGNIFVWKTATRDLEEESDDSMRVKLKGTIKDHDDYNGQKQTMLTRCKVI